LSLGNQIQIPRVCLGGHGDVDVIHQNSKESFIRTDIQIPLRSGLKKRGTDIEFFKGDFEVLDETLF